MNPYIAIIAIVSEAGELTPVRSERIKEVSIDKASMAIEARINPHTETICWIGTWETYKSKRFNAS